MEERLFNIYNNIIKILVYMFTLILNYNSFVMCIKIVRVQLPTNFLVIII